MSTGTNTVSYVAAVAGALVRRPSLIPTACRQVVAMRARGWWRRPPFLPLPAADYVEFRQVTATGSTVGSPSVDDTIVWLEWCRTMRALPD